MNVCLYVHNQGGTASKFSSLSRDEGFFVCLKLHTNVFIKIHKEEHYETDYWLRGS